MQKISFRAKHVNSGQWIKSMTISYGSIKRKSDDLFMEVGENKWLGVNKKTFGQFTGICDKNGIEIYDGDILLDVEFDENGNDISGKFPVVYDSSKCQFAIDNSFKKDGSNLVNLVDYFGIENLEVVGNIHDNPEMLDFFVALPLTTKASRHRPAVSYLTAERCRAGGLASWC